MSFREVHYELLHPSQRSPCKDCFFELVEKRVCSAFCEARAAYAVLSQAADMAGAQFTLVCMENGPGSCYESLMAEMGVCDIEEACEVVFLLEIDYPVIVPRKSRTPHRKPRKRIRINEPRH